jgi:hypothetical protein
MHNERRYQAKIHTISKKLSKEKNKILHFSTNFFLLKKIEKQQRHAMGKIDKI